MPFLSSHVVLTKGWTDKCSVLSMLQGFPALAQQQIWQKFGQTQWLLFSSGCWTGPYSWGTSIWSKVTLMTWMEWLLAHICFIKSNKDTFTGGAESSRSGIQLQSIFKCKQDIKVSWAWSLQRGTTLDSRIKDHFSGQTDSPHTCIMWVEWDSNASPGTNIPTVWAILKFPTSFIGSCLLFTAFLLFSVHHSSLWKGQKPLNPSPQLPPGDGFK